MNPEPQISSACSQCGFCQVVCPTETLGSRSPSDGQLLDQLTSSCRLSPEGRTTTRVHCQQAESPNADAARVPCLGLVGHHALVGAVLSGVDEVRLIKGRCSECRLKPGEALLDDAIRTSTIILEGLGLSEFSIRLEVAENNGERRFGRREIFSFFGSRPTPPTSYSLRVLLEDLGPHGDDIEYDERLPWARIRIDRDSCTACGTCVAVCPTGALGQAFEDPYQVFYFRSSRCTNCSLCREACPEQAVEFEERISAADILEESWKTICRIELTSCTFCGETIPTAEGEICPTCEKRLVGASWAGIQK